MKSLFVPAAAALALTALTPVMAMAEAPARVISVSGEGRVSVAPDMANLTIGVRHEAATAREAMDLMNAGLTPVLDRLRAAGIADGDIQTGALGLDPIYTYNDNAPPVVTGYAAYSNVQVLVRDIAQVGAVLDAAISDGANSLGGISFGVTDQAAALEEARRAAVADAAARAVLYAEAAGVALGPVLQISEARIDGPVKPMFDMVRMPAPAAQVAIAAGEVDIAASISIVYGIAE